MSNERSVVFLDVGGPIYDDRVYADALRVGLRAGGADVPDADFDREYERCRREQAGFTGPLARRFGVDAAVLERAAAASWRYPPEAMHADVLPSLRRVAAGFSIGVLANQPAATRAALERDGVAPFVRHWVLSGDLGLSKPDPRLFAHAIDVAGRTPERVAYVGNRLDNDVRPARAAGMRTVWILRGEAPAAPTASQRAEADVVIRSLAELPDALERIGLSAVR